MPTVQSYSATARVKSLAGSNTAPGITFTGDTDTGLYSPGANQVAIATGGVQRLLIGSDGSITTASPLLFPTGTASAPSITFNGDTDTGLYSPGANQVAISTSGTGRLFVDASGRIGVGTSTLGVPLTVQSDSGQASLRIVGRSADNISYAEFTNSAQAVTYGFVTSGPTYLAVGTGSTEALRITSGSQLLTGTLGTAAAPVLSFTGDTNTGIYSPGADQIAISTNGTGRLFVDASGRVYANNSTAIGPGTATPTRTLQLSDTTGQPAIKLTNDASGHLTTDGADITFTGTNLFITNREAGAIVAEANGSERLRIDSSGRLLVGTSTARSNYLGGGTAPSLQVEGTGFATSALSLTRNETSGSGAGLLLGRSRGAANGSNTAVIADDGLGIVSFQGADGTNLIEGARISAAVDGTPGTNDMPGRLVFSTTADGASSPTERMRIDSAGQIEAGSLGTAAAPVWSFLSDPNTGIYSPGADQVAISTNGTGRLFVDASGNIATGVATYSKPLTINNANAAIALRANSGGSYSDHGIFFAVDGTNYSQIYNDGPGQLIFRTGSGLAERLRITSAGLVGVGTSSPVWPLDVRGSGNFFIEDGFLGLDAQSSPRVGFVKKAGASPIIAVGSATAFQISHSSATDISAVSTNTYTPRFTIDTSGRVGVGTTSPGYLLHVNGGTTFLNNLADNASSTPLQLSNNSSTGTCVVKLAFSNGGSVKASINAAVLGNDYLAFNTGGDAERARIDGSGRLLVGTSSSVWGGGIESIRTTGTQFVGARFSADNFPSETEFLKSRGATVGTNTVVQNNDVIANLNFRGADGSTYIPAAQISAQVDGTPGANDMPGRIVLSTTADGASSPTERMRITQNGFTKASNTGAYLSTTAAYHEFRSDAGSGALTLNISNSNATGNGIQSGLNSDGTAYAHFIGYSTSAAANRIIIWSNGNVVNTNNSYGAISDIKLKENIVDASSQWDDLKALQVRNYNFKEGQTHTQIGLIAQEVELVSPGLVTESPDRDADGNDLSTVTKSVNYSVLYMKAVKALQEAMERIETLEQRLNDAGIS